MSAHAIIEFITRAGEKIKCKALSSVLSISPKFNEFNNIWAQMQDSIYHMINHMIFVPKVLNFAIRKWDVFTDVNTTSGWLF